MCEKKEFFCFLPVFRIFEFCRRIVRCRRVKRFFFFSSNIINYGRIARSDLRRPSYRQPFYADASPRIPVGRVWKDSWHICIYYFCFISRRFFPRTIASCYLFTVSGQHARNSFSEHKKRKWLENTLEMRRVSFVLHIMKRVHRVRVFSQYSKIMGW